MKPSEVYEEFEKMTRMARQRPLLTLVALLVVAIPLAYVARQALRDTFVHPPVDVVIEVPMDGSAVGAEERIRGSGASQTGYWYPVVTALETGGVFVAGTQITVHTDGTWEGLARFGDTVTPVGARFQVQIGHSDSRLQQEALGDRVSDVRLSKSVSVVRR